MEAALSWRDFMVSDHTDDGAARGVPSDADDDLSTLLDLVRHAVGAMPGRAQATLNKALEQVVADLAMAG